MERFAFASPSLTKYVASVAVPLAATAVVLAPDPFLVFVAGVVFVGPFATLTVSVMGVSFTALAIACVLAAIPVLLGRTRPVGSTALGRVLPFVAILVAVPVARGTGIGDSVGIAVVAAVVCFFCARAVRRPGGIATVLISGLAALVVQATVAIWEYRTHSEFDLYSGALRGTTNYFFDFQSQSRPTGTFADPISLGTSLMAAAPVGLAVVCLLLERRRRLAAGVTTGLIAVVGVGLALSLSRMAALGLLASLVAIVVFAPGAVRARVGRFATTMLAVVVLGAVVLGGASLVERASSLRDPTAAGVVTADGDRTREQLWRAAMQVGMDNPLVGVGVGNVDRILVQRVPGGSEFTHAHSVYLQIFSAAGIAGLAALALLLIALIVDLRRARRQAPLLAAGLAGAVVALGVAAVTDVVMIRYVAVAATVAPVFGLVAGLAGQDRDGRRQ
jgi:O-antigen ligase